MKRNCRICAALFTAMLILTALVPAALAAENDTGTDGDYSWIELADGTVSITAYTGAGGDITIPATLSGKTVSAVGAAVFKDNAALTSVAFAAPANIKEFGNEAFRTCQNMTSFTMPDTVTDIGEYAFYADLGLTALSLPSSLESIGQYAFYSATGLDTVTWPTGLEEMGNYAFGNSDLENPVLLASVTTLGERAFSGCWYASSVVIEEGVEDTGVGTFSGLANITSITLPSTLKTIGSESFKSLSSNITSISLPSSLETIGSYAFQFNRLTSLSFPASVTTIETGAFKNSISLTSVTVPDTVTTLGAEAFMDCDQMLNATLGSGITTVPVDCFNQSTLMHTVTMSSGITAIADTAFYQCQDLATINFPDTLQTIGVNSFTNNVELYEISLPDTVTSIGAGAFNTSFNLDKVTLPAATTTFGVDAFGGTDLGDGGVNGMYCLSGSDAETYAIAQGFTVHTIEKITFDSQGGSAVASAYGEIGDTVADPGDPTRGTDDFDGWFDNAEGTGSAVTFPYTIAGTATLYADWTVYHTVTFDSQGGSAVSPETVADGSPVSEPSEPTLADNDFGGWWPTAECDTTQITFPYTPTASVTLFAKWTPEYTVTFDSKGGSAVPGETVTKGTAIDAPSEPTKDGFEFDGWYETYPYSGDAVTFPYTVNADVTLYAKWKNVYTVTFDSKGGSAVSAKTAADGSAVAKPADPAKDGYDFCGWYESASYSGSAVSFPYTVTADITLYAKWEAVASPTPTPSPSESPEPTATASPQLIDISGTLTDQDGNPLAGYTVELRSDPQTDVTDADGRFSFTNVDISDHTLTLFNNSGQTLETFEISLESGSDFEWSRDEDGSIDITVEGSTSSLDFSVALDMQGESIAGTVDDVAHVENPQTSGLFGMWYIFVGALLALAFGLLALKWRTMVYIGRHRA